MAGANLADGSDGYLQFSNPAQLPQLKSIGISSSFMLLPLDRSIQTLSITKSLPPSAGIALSLYRSATSNIQGRDLMNQFTENLDVSGASQLGIYAAGEIYFRFSIAAENCNTDIVKILIGYGARV